MSDYNTLTYEARGDGIGVITLNRPECLNAISWEMVEELHACLTELEQAVNTRVVILTGAGRGFCSGTDLKGGRSGGGPPDVPKIVREGSRSQRRIGDVVLHMRKIPQPIIGAINGVAAGGGFSFSMACDIRIAANSARFICSFINVGLSSGDVGSSYFLPRLIGMSRAAELLYTGREMGAAEAERIGYISKAVPDGAVFDAALDIAKVLLGKSPFGLRMTKEILNQSIDSPGLEASLYLENRSQTLATLTGDFQVAMAAFKDKRPPVFPPEI
jgi:enoyl-CoA hydratase/carnithine racemase